MGFSKEWEVQFSKQQHLSIYPWSDLVSYVMRYAKPKSQDFRVLELGVGAGANIPFFMDLGVDYVGVDGSDSVIQRLKESYPTLDEKLLTMDFTKEIPTGKFDLIIDRAAITHNSTKNIITTINQIKNALSNKGCFIGIDWFSTAYSDYTNTTIGKRTTDEYTKSFLDSESRSFGSLGNVHFSDVGHLKNIFKDFNICHLQHKIIEELDDKSDWKFASFNFVATKK